LKPLSLIEDRADLPELDLPPELSRLYGGGLGLASPSLFANFVQTLDGVVAIPDLPKSNVVIAAGSEGDRFVMGLLRACADAILVGSGTMRGSPQGTWRADRAFPDAAEAFAELRRRRGQPERALPVFLTGGRSFDPDHPVLETGALVLTTEAAAPGVRAGVPAATEVEAVCSGDRVDPAAAVAALHARGHMQILSEAGPHLFASLVEAGLVDELFLTVSPLLAGGVGSTTRSLVEGVDSPWPAPARASLMSCRCDESHVFLRYAFR
jgi:riboflavin biosynthesis pyrimidine reductase